MERKALQYTTIKALYYKGRSHYGLEQYSESINCYFSQLKQLEIADYERGSFRILYNIGLGYDKLDENHTALRYYDESLMHLTAQSIKKIEQFEEDFITTDADKIDNEQNDTLRNIAVVYKKLGNLEKAIAIYTKIKNKYQSNIDSLKTQLDSSSSASVKKSVYSDRIWKLYFSVKNNLAMAYAETGEIDKALEEVEFVYLSSNEDYITATMFDTKGYIYYKIRTIRLFHFLLASK